MQFCNTSLRQRDSAG